MSGAVAARRGRGGKESVAPPVISVKEHGDYSCLRFTLMHDPLPIHLSADGSVATWNPALTRSNQVVVRVRCGDVVSERPSMNSGRVRVRPGEQIEAVTPAG